MVSSFVLRSLVTYHHTLYAREFETSLSKTHPHWAYIREMTLFSHQTEIFEIHYWIYK